jgi:hypothetical protein
MTSFVQDPGQEAGRLVAQPGVPALSLRSKVNRLGVFTIRSVQMIQVSCLYMEVVLSCANVTS